MPYIHFTEEQKRQANRVNLVEFLRFKGEPLTRSGRELRMERNHSVTVHGNEWYDHAAEKGGGPVSFLKEFYGMNYQQAVLTLLNEDISQLCSQVDTPQEKKQKPFALPPANENNRRVFAYLLKHRHLDRDVLTTFIRLGLIYEDQKYHNAVFVGRDKDGTARHAHKRSTNSQGKPFRMTVEGSDFRYAFNWPGSSGHLLVFEAPIDMLSFIEDGILDPAVPDFERRYWVMRRMNAMFRVLGYSWWPEEMPNEAEYAEAEANLERAGWCVDCILTHCAPTSIAQRLNQHYQPDKLTDFLETVKQQCRFSKWFCGHYHVNQVIDERFMIQWEQVSRID